MLLEKMKI